MAEHDNHSVPRLDESLGNTPQEATQIAIPVLQETLDQDTLEQLLADNLALPDDLREQLTRRLAELVQSKLAAMLPELMEIIQQEIADSLQQHIAETLPSVINELLKQPK